MNWIEQLFGIMPDANSGASEFAMGFVVALSVACLAVWRGRRTGSGTKRVGATKQAD
jgi:hypothetical protein